MLYSAAVYHDEAGKPLGVFAAARDVTERKRAEAELARHREHLEELVKDAPPVSKQPTRNSRRRSRSASAVEDELRASNEELARFNRAAVDRELRMIELKKEVNAKCDQLGQPPLYPLAFEKESS